MSNVKKTLQMTSLLFGMTILFCYIGWYLGYEGFIIVGDIILPYWIEFLIRFTSLLIYQTLQGGFILKEYNWYILKYSTPLVILEAIRSIFFLNIPSVITLGFIPIVWFLVIGVILKKKMLYFEKINSFPFHIPRGLIIRLLIINIVSIVHQGISSKITKTFLDHSISLYTGLRLNLDITLVNLLFYSIGGVNNGHERMVFPGLLGNDPNSSSSFPQSVDGIPVDNFEKWIMRSVIAIAQPIQWMFILWVCNRDNLFLDALVMTTSFICHGKIISKRKHLKPVILCTLAATAMFYFVARFTIPFQYAQLFHIFIGLLLVYSMYRIDYQFELAAKEKAQIDLDRIALLEKQMSQAWQQLDELS